MAIEQSFIPIGETGEKLDSVRVDTPAGLDLHRETVVAADPENPDGLGRVVNAEPAADVYAAAVRAVGVNAKLDSLIAKPAQLDALTDAQLRAAAVQTKDTADIEYTPVATTVSSAGDTTVYTPAAGKRVRLHWVYALSDPRGANSVKITIKIGSQVYYVTWGITKRQQFTGAVNAPVVVNLSAAGEVAVSLLLEEID